MLNKISFLLIIFIASVVILIYSQSILIPFIMALLLWFLIRKMRMFVDKIGFVKERIPIWVKNLLISVVVFIFLGTLSNILIASVSALATSYKVYESNISIITLKIDSIFNIDLIQIIKAHSSDFNFGLLLGVIVSAIKSIVGNIFMVILYTLFIFFEEAYFIYKLKAIFKEEEQFLKVTKIIEQVELSIEDYIGLKTLLSFISGFLSYFVFLIIGIDSPVFWSFLVFSLNFIPTIGVFISTMLPSIFALLQFGVFTPCIMVLIFIGTIQLLVGNILEPKLMGNSLNISTLVTIVALSFWGTLWGITGMILSIPITVIIMILCSQFESTKSIAVLLSAKGVLLNGSIHEN